jgi:hypothetical protein
MAETGHWLAVRRWKSLYLGRAIGKIQQYVKGGYRLHGQKRIMGPEDKNKYVF